MHKKKYVKKCSIGYFAPYPQARANSFVSFLCICCLFVCLFVCSFVRSFFVSRSSVKRLECFCFCNLQIMIILLSFSVSNICYSVAKCLSSRKKADLVVLCQLKYPESDTVLL